MRRLALIVVLLISAAGCKRSSSPPVVARSIDERRIVLPAAPVLAVLTGKWGQNGKVVVSVVPDKDGSAVLQIPEPAEGWRAEIRNARIDNGKVTYEQYYYARDVPDSPLEGVRHTVTLESIPSFRDRARLSVATEGAESAVQILTRME